KASRCLAGHHFILLDIVLRTLFGFSRFAGNGDIDIGQLHPTIVALEGDAEGQPHNLQIPVVAYCADTCNGLD
ncbi:MAG: hypothetical protein QNI97_10885, partial [Desulfobacterales bacterium]|nr:hypothetical protein [Desulfobacterales bacterium]